MSANPFAPQGGAGGSSNPFASQGGASSTGNPFAQSNSNPFAGSNTGASSNPYGNAYGQSNPFSKSTTSGTSAYKGYSYSNQKPTQKEPPITDLTETASFPTTGDIKAERYTFAFKTPSSHEIKGENIHILRELYINKVYDEANKKTDNQINPNFIKYSLMQIHYFDYLKRNTQFRPKIYKDGPEVTISDDTDPNKEKKGEEAQPITSNIQPDINYDTVFDNQQQEIAKINTAGKFFVPKRKRVDEPQPAPVAKDRFRAPKSVPKTTSISKNYDFLFESPITYSSQIKEIDRKPIVISEDDQLTCKEPQNSRFAIKNRTDGFIKIVREPYGSIQFLENVGQLENYDISSFITIEQNYVNIDIEKIDDFDAGNLKAIVTLHKLYPVSFDDVDQETPESINEKNQLYENILRNYCRENGLSFIGYFPDSSTLIFIVNDFRKGPFSFPFDLRKQ